MTSTPSDLAARLNKRGLVEQRSIDLWLENAAEKGGSTPSRSDIEWPETLLKSASELLAQEQRIERLEVMRLDDFEPKRRIPEDHRSSRMTDWQTRAIAAEARLQTAEGLLREVIKHHDEGCGLVGAPGYCDIGYEPTGPTEMARARTFLREKGVGEYTQEQMQQRMYDGLLDAGMYPQIAEDVGMHGGPACPHNDTWEDAARDDARREWEAEISLREKGAESV